jgi:hypothetical protein
LSGKCQVIFPAQFSLEDHLQEYYIVLCSDLFAIMALQFQVFFVDDGEAGGDGLVIGDAVRVKAFYNSLDFIRDGEFAFNDYTEVFDLDQGCRGSYQRDHVDLPIGKITVADFDDSFAIFELFAFKVDPDKNLIFFTGEFQEADYLEDTVRGDMIDYRSVFKGRYF